MTATIEAAGYVVSHNEAVWATGATADKAWAEFQRAMDEANVALLGDDDDSGDQSGSWTRASDYTIHPASAALISDIETKGGDIGWRIANGVACTVDEAGDV